MTDTYRVLSPVTTYTGAVGEMQFVKGKYEGPVDAAALGYFANAGYTVEQITGTDVVDVDHDPASPDDDPDGAGGLPAKSAVRPEWEKAASDLGISTEDIVAASNKDQLIELVTAAAAAKAAADQQNGASQ